MKIKLLYIIIPVLMSASCSGNLTKKQSINTNPEITLQSIAVFKSSEHIYENELKLIFRKLDDSQYIIFYTDTNKMNSISDNLILSSENTYVTNPDFINLRFKINYVEETIHDHISGNKNVINRLRDINRSSSDRFAAAGFADDIKADDFILNLKNFVKQDSISEISEMIYYPLNTVIRKKKNKISNSKTFIESYNNIFTKNIKNIIISQPLSDIKADSKGIFIGSDKVRINIINDKIYITSIIDN